MATLSALPGDDSLLEFPRMLRDPIGFLTERHRRYGDVFKTRWVVPMVIAVGQEANRAIQITERKSYSIPRGYSETGFGRVFSGSLVLSEGMDHRREREVIRNAMSQLSFDGIVDVWQRAAERLGDGRAHDVYELLRDVTFEVAANVLLGLRLSEPELAQWRPWFEAVVAASNSWGIVNLPFTRMHRGLEARDELIRRLVKRIESDRPEGGSGLLDLLADATDEAGARMPPVRVAEHLLLLFWAGYDTTAAMGSWLLTELSDAPEWQARLRDELTEVVGDGRLERQHLDALIWQGCTLKEIERLRPPAVLNPRRTSGPVEISGLEVPSDTRVFYSAYLSHHDERIYERPDTFDPGRWHPSHENAPSAAHLVGFGAGPRVCVGKGFGQLQMRVLMWALLSRYRLRRRPGRVGAVVFTMYRPKNVRLHFEPL